MAEQDYNSLAQAIAQGLGELESVSSFRTLLKRYPEDIIRKAYEDTLAIPQHRVRKTKGAIFIFLLKKYARQSSPTENLGH